MPRHFDAMERLRVDANHWVQTVDTLPYVLRSAAVRSENLRDEAQREIFPVCTVFDWDKSTSASPVCLPCLACRKKWRGTYSAPLLATFGQCEFGLRCLCLERDLQFFDRDSRPPPFDNHRPGIRGRNVGDEKNGDIFFTHTDLGHSPMMLALIEGRVSIATSIPDLTVNAIDADGKVIGAVRSA